MGAIECYDRSEATWGESSLSVSEMQLNAFLRCKWDLYETINSNESNLSGNMDSQVAEMLNNVLLGLSRGLGTK